MKKLFLLIFCLSILGVFVACDNGGGVVINEPVTYSEKLVISKIITDLESMNLENNIIELYNNSDDDVLLDNYRLRFYKNGSFTFTDTIKITGTVKANDYYVIVGANFNAQIVVEPHFIYEGSLPYNGDDAIALAHNTKIMDMVGPNGGIAMGYSNNRTLIRLGNLSDYEVQSVYDEFNFIAYVPNAFEYIGNDEYEIKTKEQLYAGPRLEEKYKNMPYISPTNPSAGGGGAVSATVGSVSDGDTARYTTSVFINNSVRYEYINTPEVNGTMQAEAWGYVASRYNKYYILANWYRCDVCKEAVNVPITSAKPSTCPHCGASGEELIPIEKNIYVQSIEGNTLIEQHGRYMGLVWINDSLSQFLTVSEGLSEDVPVAYGPNDVKMTYKNVPILTFLRHAENRAILNGWGTKGYPIKLDGEQSPDWNYQANGGAGAWNGKTDTNIVWTPHNKIPWL